MRRLTQPPLHLLLNSFGYGCVHFAEGLRRVSKGKRKQAGKTMDKRRGRQRLLNIGGFLFFVTAVSGFGAENDPDAIAKHLAGLTVPAAPADAPPQLSAHTPQSAQVRRALPAATPRPVVTRVPRPGSAIPYRQQASSPSDRGSVPQPSSSSTLNPSTSQPSGNPWLIHSSELDRAWKRTEQQQLSSIATWASQFLGSAYQANNTVFYMFSGPDFLYAHAFFPDARTYVFCGNEPVGAPPDLDKVPPAALPAALANIRKSLESVLNWSFFITKDMKTDLTRPELSGTVPLLYVFLARTGCTIQSVTPVAIDRDGNVNEGEKGQTPGIRIVFTSGPSSQTLYYFCSDLSDDGVKATPGFLRFCEKQGEGVSFLKAASYLMHETGFSRVRDFLLGNSRLIVQDDSGIPMRFLAQQNWNVRYCGRYRSNRDIQEVLATGLGRRLCPSDFGAVAVWVWLSMAARPVRCDDRHAAGWGDQPGPACKCFA